MTMQENEIEIGAVYRCRGGWFRRPTSIEMRDGIVDVEYDLGWTPDATKGHSHGPLPWFAGTAYERVDGQ